MQPLLQHDVAMLSLKKWDTACKSFKNFKPEKANFFFCNHCQGNKILKELSLPSVNGTEISKCSTSIKSLV